MIERDASLSEDDDLAVVPMLSRLENSLGSDRSSVRKSPLRLGEAALRTCNTLLSAGTTSKELAQKTILIIRAAQRHIQNYHPVDENGVCSPVAYKKCGPKVTSHVALHSAIMI
jgi:hypothetical protein